MRRLIRDSLIDITNPNAPRLRGCRCASCGYVGFPRREICPACYEPLEELLLSQRGTLYTYVVSHIALTGFAAPYVMGYVDLPEGPRVFTLIAECDPENPNLDVGQEMEVVVEPIRKNRAGADLFGYKFRPVRPG